LLAAVVVVGVRGTVFVVVVAALPCLLASRLVSPPPEIAAVAPRKYPGRVVQLAPMPGSRKLSAKPKLFVVCGLRPVKKEFRLGAHHAIWQNAEPKSVEDESRARASMCGLNTSVLP
jgi:hypothetical protein